MGSVKIRNLTDYEHVTDTGILQQILDDNGYSGGSDVTGPIKSIFIEGLRNHIEDVGSFPIIDGAVQFLEESRKSDDTRIGIATGGWRESALLKLQSAGFNIDGVPLVTSDDSPSRTEIMRLALKKTGGFAGPVTYFGDAEWDERACQELGWNFVAVGRGLNGIESYTDIEW